MIYVLFFILAALLPMMAFDLAAEIMRIITGLFLND